jgi:hypothetical protein
MEFKSDFSDQSEYVLQALMYGRPKVGKTRCALDVVRKGHYMVLLSFDRGARPHLMREPQVFNGKVALAEPGGLVETREAVNEAGEKVRKLVKAGIPSGKIWVVVDTITHLQMRLMQEARKIDQAKPAHEDRESEDFLRDYQTQIDWGINLTLMGEQASRLTSYGCNLVYIALEKSERPKNQPEKSAPSLSGQSKDRFTGDVDVILHMTQDDNGNRYFETNYSGGGGDRTGELAPREPADLIHILNKCSGLKVSPSIATGEKAHGNEAEAQNHQGN